MPGDQETLTETKKYQVQSELCLVQHRPGLHCLGCCCWLKFVKLDQVHAAHNNKDCISGRKLFKIRDKHVKLSVAFFVNYML